MSNDYDPADDAEEEIAFWNGFIEWWEAKEGRPATPRMREALAYAKAKRRLPGEGVSQHAIATASEKPASAKPTGRRHSP